MSSRHQLVLLLAAALPLGAQSALPGYSASNSAAQRTLEAQAIARPDAARARAHSKALSVETHVAGTPAQSRTRDYVIAQMKAMGLETEVRRYDVFLPHPTSVQVWRTSPRPKALSLAEPAVAGDPASKLAQYLTVNGYSGAGDVRGDVIYVNYGLIEDYAQLDSLGISVKGRIAVARYGRSFRGIKAREAEKHGATALLIYSDPQQDGYVNGDVYPKGPMCNKDGVQRGSVLNGAGDPATPGYASVAGAPRLTEEKMTIPRIPVVPLSYGNATELPFSIDANVGWLALVGQNGTIVDRVDVVAQPADTSRGRTPNGRSCWALFKRARITLKTASRRLASLTSAWVKPSSGLGTVSL